MKVLVTGAHGFIGRNLVLALARRPGIETRGYDLDTDGERLDDLVGASEAVFHLAGVNRPKRVEEYREGNAQLTRRLCSALSSAGRARLLVISSSTQAALDNPYGVSKREAERMAFAFARESEARVRVFRLPGVFGKWCRPNYNSVVATFCHNLARDLPITVSDPEKRIDLVHVDAVVRAFVGLLGGEEPSAAGGYCQVEPVYQTSLGDLAQKLRGFQDLRTTLRVPDFSDDFTRLLHSTYVSYLPEGQFAYALEQRADRRGELAELLRSRHFGQIFISRTRPGITRGNHYHDAKVEKFVVVDGEAIVRFRDVLGETVTEYPVSGPEFKVVDIPPGYTHNITNVGASDLVVLFWANEPFDPERPDTFAEEV